MGELYSLSNEWLADLRMWIDLLWGWFLYISVRPEFTITLYTLWGIYKFMMGIGRISRYYVIMRERSAFYLAISDFLQSVAFIGAALLTAPHPLYKFSFLLPWIRLIWLLALPFFITATHLKGWFVAQMIYAHHDSARRIEHANDTNEAVLQKQDNHHQYSPVDPGHPGDAGN